MPQLTFYGKKTVPSKYRKDDWRPYAAVQFSSRAHALIAFTQLRDLRMLRDYGWRKPGMDIVNRTMKRRRQWLMDHRGTSVADLSTVVDKMGKLAWFFDTTIYPQWRAVEALAAEAEAGALKVLKKQLQKAQRFFAKTLRNMTIRERRTSEEDRQKLKASMALWYQEQTMMMKALTAAQHVQKASLQGKKDRELLSLEKTHPHNLLHINPSADSAATPPPTSDKSITLSVLEGRNGKISRVPPMLESLVKEANSAAEMVKFQQVTEIPMELKRFENPAYTKQFGFEVKTALRHLTAQMALRSYGLSYFGNNAPDAFRKAGIVFEDPARSGGARVQADEGAAKADVVQRFLSIRDSIGESISELEAIRGQRAGNDSGIPALEARFKSIQDTTATLESSISSIGGEPEVSEVSEIMEVTPRKPSQAPSRTPDVQIYWDELKDRAFSLWPETVVHRPMGPLMGKEKYIMLFSQKYKSKLAETQAHFKHGLRGNTRLDMDVKVIDVKKEAREKRDRWVAKQAEEKKKQQEKEAHKLKKREERGELEPKRKVAPPPAYQLLRRKRNELLKTVGSYERIDRQINEAVIAGRIARALPKKEANLDKAITLEAARRLGDLGQLADLKVVEARAAYLAQKAEELERKAKEGTTNAVTSAPDSSGRRKVAARA
jgi:hypothetical protein